MNITKVVSLNEAEELSASFMSPAARAYVCGAAGDEITMRANSEEWRRIRLNPRILVDASEIDTRTQIFGQTLDWPVLLAPAAINRLWHPQGEMAVTHGANQGGVTTVASTYATESIGNICRAAKHPVWFQLYTRPEREFNRELVSLAETAGCKAIVITVDTPVIGIRNREARAYFRMPPNFTLPNIKMGPEVHRRSPWKAFGLLPNPKLTWKEVEWICSIAKVPVLLKGVINPDDALRAIDTGAAGIIVSNHGSRNLDTLPPTAEALPRVAEKLEGKLPLLVDGGIRRGTDIIKALALGAKAVLIGRPYLHGLAIGGAKGVARVLEILRNEFEAAMALTGRMSISEIDRSVIWPDRLTQDLALTPKSRATEV